MTQQPTTTNILCFLILIIGVFVIGFGVGAAVDIPQQPIDDFNAGAVLLSSKTGLI